MNRPVKSGTECFPVWSPHFRTEEKFWGSGNASYKALRNSSSSFIKNKAVIAAIKEKCNDVCTFCGGGSDLQIDHIITVYQAFKDKRYIGLLNSYQNLQILCRSCNASKRPEG